MTKLFENGDIKPESPENIVRDNFFAWNDALKTGDHDKVAEFYSAGATFLPTVSGEFKKGSKGAAEYFTHFLEKNPTGEIIEEEI